VYICCTTEACATVMVSSGATIHPHAARLTH